MTTQNEKPDEIYLGGGHAYHPNEVFSSNPDGVLLAKDAWELTKYIRADLTQPFKCPDGLSCSGDGSDCVGQYRCEPAQLTKPSENISCENVTNADVSKPSGDVGEALIGLNKLHFNKPSGCPEDIGDDDGVDLEQLDSWFNTHYHTIKRALSQLTKAPKNVTCGDVSNGALLNSEQILIDALKFYATKEHWMANTENGQPFTLCALKHALDYAGWVHAHGQLQRWAIAKHFESERALSQQPDAKLLAALKDASAELNRRNRYDVQYETTRVLAIVDFVIKRAEQKGQNHE